MSLNGLTAYIELAIQKQKIKIKIMSNHYRLQDREPSAIVLATNPATRSLDEVKIYAGKEIYLSPKQNFALRFFNPLQETIGAKLTLNGTTFPDMLVLKPGEDVVLERFLNDNKKFLFDTYEIDGNNSAAVNAIAKNGSVKIEFFKERQVYHQSFNTTTTWKGTWSGSISGCSNGSYGTINTCGMSNPATFDVSNSNARLYSASVPFFNTSCCTDSLNETLSDIIFGNAAPKAENKIETGRIEKGEESEQKLDTVQMSFEYNSFYTLEYKMLPVSVANTNKEIREYCDGCKYRVRNEKWMYCPKCGKKLD